MSKWLESLGLGAQKPKGSSSPAIARIRETMRWRGYDLSAYSDDEIEAARIVLGDGVSETGETTHASREALAGLLRERRQKGIPPEMATPPVPAEPAPAMPAESPPVESPSAAAELPVEEESQPAPSARDERSETAGAPPVSEPTQPAAERDRPAPSEDPVPAAEKTAPTAEGYKPEPGRYKSPLLLGMHAFGLHSWKYRDDPPGPRLRCDGCGKERPADRRARPTVVPPAPGGDRDDTDTNQDPITLRPQDARDAWSSDRSIDDPGLRSAPPPRPATPRPRQGESGTQSLFQRFLRSPWWVKTVAIFFLLQVVGMLASLFSGGPS